MTARLPYDYARCTSRDADDVVCPKRDTCKRYLAPGREHWQSWVLSKWDGEKCEMRIPTDE